MSNTPTRELDDMRRKAVRQSADYLEQQYLNSGQHMSIELIDVLAAARLWLEGPTVDEAMIERAAHALAEWLNTPGFWDASDVRDQAERMLRAAWEVTDD